MSHVDEGGGALHAYLDGELPSVERAALEAHVAQCESCRARLAEERALLDRANALLGASRPVERPMPSFEQLRALPAPRKRSPWRVRTSLAWAASLVLALGVGYGLHDVGSYRAAPAANAPVPVVSERDGYNAPAARHEAKATERPRRLYAARRDETAAQDAGRLDTGAMKVALGARLLTRSAAPNTGALPAPAPAIDSALVVVDAVTSQAERQRAAATPAPSMQQTNRLEVRKPSENTWPRIDRQTAKSILGEDPVGLPDLDTRTIRRSPDRDGVVVVEQQLDDRTVIEIFQQSARASASRFDSLVYGRSSGGYGYAFSTDRERADRLARFVGKLRVEIGGPVSVDSLNRLLDQVAPLP